MFDQKSSLHSSYVNAICDDTVPRNDEVFGERIKSQPKLLVPDVDESEIYHSVLMTAYRFGAFHFTDFILKEGENFTKGADPFYCGQEEGGLVVLLNDLLNSAGLNIYLALMTLRFYAQQSKSNHRLDETKTYYDFIYWENQNKKYYVDIERSDEYGFGFQVVKAYKEQTVKWFMKKADKIFKIETALAQTIALIEKQRLHALLGKAYLQIAYMEDYHSNKKFYYFLDKSLEHYQQSSLQHQAQYVPYLQFLIQYREQLFKFQCEKRKEQCYVKEAEIYRVRTPNEWIACYNAATQRNYLIKDDGKILCENRYINASGACFITREAVLDEELRQSITSVSDRSSSSTQEVGLHSDDSNQSSEVLVEELNTMPAVDNAFLPVQEVNLLQSSDIVQITSNPNSETKDSALQQWINWLRNSITFSFSGENPRQVIPFTVITTKKND